MGGGAAAAGRTKVYFKSFKLGLFLSNVYRYEEKLNALPNEGVIIRHL